LSFNNIEKYYSHCYENSNVRFGIIGNCEQILLLRSNEIKKSSINFKIFDRTISNKLILNYKRRYENEYSYVNTIINNLEETNNYIISIKHNYRETPIELIVTNTNDKWGSNYAYKYTVHNLPIGIKEFYNYTNSNCKNKFLPIDYIKITYIEEDFSFYLLRNDGVSAYGVSGVGCSGNYPIPKIRCDQDF